MRFFVGDRDRIQTYNLLIRSQMLYSIELRSQYFNSISVDADWAANIGQNRFAEKQNEAIYCATQVHTYQATLEILCNF